MKHTFESIEPGMEFGPIEQVLDRHVATAFAFSVDDFHHMGANGVLPEVSASYSAWAAKRLMHLYMLTVFDPQGVKAVHVKEDFEFLAPVKLGSKLTLRGRCVDKYVRKGRGMVACVSEALDESGRVLVRQHSLEIVPRSESSPIDDTEPAGGVERLSARHVAGKKLDVAAVNDWQAYKGGQAVLPTLHKTIHQDQIGVFCGADEGWRNLHTSQEVANEAGFDRPLMSGLIHSCWFVELLTRFFGSGVMQNLRLGSTYLSPVQAGANVECYGQIVESSADRVGVELWSEADGKMAASGFAEILLPLN